MAPRQEPDECESFAEDVSHAEGRAVRRNIFDPETALFKGSFVVVLIGAVWGIAIAFQSFKVGGENTRADVDALRLELGKVREELVKLRDERRAEVMVLRSKMLYIRELDLWADSLRFQNGGKVFVPKPSEFKIEP